MVIEDESIERLLGTGRFVGGGTKVLPEQRSAGILATYAVVELLVVVTGQIRAVMKGTDTAWVDRYFFDDNR